MSGEMKNILKIACIYVATIIGAGFASGQEIVQFFSNYNNGGFYGIILAGLLFAVIGYVVLDKVYTERIKDFDELLFPAVGWIFGWVIEIAVTLFMLSIFCIMIAGAGNVFQDKLNIPYNIGICLMVAICMISLLSDTKGIVFISSFIAPILIVGLVAMGVFVIATKNVFVFSVAGDFSKITKNWFFSTLLYVGYNSIISIVVMSSLYTQLKTRKAAVLGGALGGLILCFIAFILNFIIYVVHPDSLVKEIPLLNISEKYSSLFSSIYAVILFLAMFVSAVTSGYCFIDRVYKKIRISKKLITVFICILIAPLSRLGFSNLISKVYPIFGYVGIFIILVVLFQSIRIQRHPKLNR
jgi:uncharacterized membrane protein YkvI